MIIKNVKVFTEDKTFEPGAIGIENGIFKNNLFDSGEIIDEMCIRDRLEIANNMKKSGGFIPGIRPGKPTVDYLAKILKYIIFIGAIGLVIVQVIPFFFNGVFGAHVSFGGTSIIIIVGVVLETLKQDVYKRQDPQH